MSDSYVPESAMVVAAHPDDIEFACAGTLVRWARAGARIVYVLCTSGESGIEDTAVSREQAMEIRETEQRAAAEIAGAAEVVFLREPDGLLEPTIGLRRRLVREVRRHRPEVVICGDPTLLWMGPAFLNHPDHRAAATAAIDAVWPAAGQPNLFREMEEEGLYAHRPRKIYVTGVMQTEADAYVDIGETIEAKLAALRAHRSQMGNGNPEPLLRKWAEENGRARGMAYAESFRVVTLVPDARWEATKGRKGTA
ncbi:MAG: PIG-L deacetylase family protein [Acidobacteriota bacterium]